MAQDFYQLYFEAVKQILNGNPVKNLDGIRHDCNERFLKAASSGIPEEAMGYTPSAIVVSFVADAENKILRGMDPTEAYSGFEGLEPEEFRQSGRRILEHALQNRMN